MAPRDFKSAAFADEPTERVNGASPAANVGSYRGTGNAELGFVALSQVIERSEGSRWLVAGNLYSPIKQDAVLLKKGASNEAAKAFMNFLKGPEAAAIEAKFGYGTPESN